MDIERRRQEYEIEIPGVPSFNYPSWSPDGKSIVVSGLVDGRNELYRYYIEDKRVEQLTHDVWCNIHPSWSPDGKTIVYSTDKPLAADLSSKRTPGYYIATLNVETNEIKEYNLFPGAANLNPVFSPDGSEIFFLSDRDGFRNLYRFQPATGKVFQETKNLIGISGMTNISPAFSISTDTTGTLAYSYYFKGHYSIFTAVPGDLLSKEISPTDVDFTSATLPPLNRPIAGIVDKNISNRMAQPETPIDSFKTVSYRPKFKLDYISNIGVGVSTSSYMGTGMAGGVEMLFSDIVGANLFHVGLALNGEIYDFGGQLTYINQKRRFIWGASVSHVPYSYGLMGRNYGFDSNGNLHDTLFYSHIRIFESTIGAMAQFPLSKTRRFEASSVMAWYNYRVDVYSYYYYNYMYYGYKKTKGRAPDGFALQNVSLAYVVDNSSFGLASPMDGARRRIQVDKIFGEFDYWGTLVDLRKYFFVKPFSFAFKGYYYGRHGNHTLDRLYPLYLGYPWLIRGYDRSSFNSQMTPDSKYITTAQLMGNHMVIANAEIRIPFTGPERLTLFKSKFLYSELALFTDAGLAWINKDDIAFNWYPENETQRIPVVSSGVSLRINLFGMMVLEPFYAIPFQLGGLDAAYFGLNFTPGW